MSIKSKGRGTAAAIGLFLLFAGLVGGAVLYVIAERRPGQTVDRFARAPLGCTTMLEFTDTGTFYVYEEAAPLGVDADAGCEPSIDPTTPFAVEFVGDLAPSATVVDTSIEYDESEYDGRSVQRIEITEAGTYDVAAAGDDPTVIAAIGRDPNTGVDGLRSSALILAIAGLVLGLLLLVLSGRRSKKAADYVTPEGPGWGPSTQSTSVSNWPPEAPRLDQVPVNPMAPATPAVAEVPTAPPPLPSAGWAPPSGDAEDTMSAPAAPSAPVLPDTPGAASGTSPDAEHP